MGHLAPGSFLLPLPTMGVAATASQAPLVPDTAPTTAEGSIAPAPRPVVIVTIPAVRALDGTAVKRMVGDAVRQVIALSPSRDGQASPDEAGTDVGQIAFDEDGAAVEPATLDDAVVAAHSARIAVLRQKLAALQAGEGAPRFLADLRDRLHRAEAAYRLAVARTRGDPLAVARTTLAADEAGRDVPVLPRSASHRLRLAASVGAGAAPRVAVRVAHVPAGPVTLHRAVVMAAVPARTRRIAGPAWTIAGAARPIPAAQHRMVVLAHLTHRSLPHPALSYTVRFHTAMFRAIPSRNGHDHRLAARNAADRIMTHRLAQARRSLATARRLLAGEEPSVTRLARPAKSYAIDLWQWQGSDTWLLSPERGKATS